MISFMRVPRAGGRFLLRGKANTGDTGEKFTAFHRWYRRRAPVLRRTVRRPGRGREHAAARQSAASRCRFPRLPQCRTPPLRGCAPLRRSASPGRMGLPSARAASVSTMPEKNSSPPRASSTSPFGRMRRTNTRLCRRRCSRPLRWPYRVMPHALMGAEVLAVGADEAALQCRARPRAAIKAA